MIQDVVADEDAVNDDMMSAKDAFFLAGQIRNFASVDESDQIQQGI